ncbi:MAG: o-succinylbenzoate synthase [Fibrobacterota bacterium]
MMKIERIELHHIEQELVHPFQTSFATVKVRPCILTAVSAGGITGWAQTVAGGRPHYSAETNETAWHMLKDYLAAPLIGFELHVPADIFRSPGYAMVRGNHMAKASLEMAVWDLFAKAQNVPLQVMFGSRKPRVEVGVSIGIQSSIDDLLIKVEQAVAMGYCRIKIKIKPGWDIVPLQAIRDRFPSIKLMCDANSAYTVIDAPLFQEMDALNLLMIEQPFAHDDIIDHSGLQAKIHTPICLDESIHTLGDARLAMALKACGIINIKVGRVGGLHEALAIHNFCAERNVPVWCGGMLETGIGTAANLHLSSCPNFSLPSDITVTDKLYQDEITEPEFVFHGEDSTVSVPQGPGIGVKVLLNNVEKLRKRHLIFK